VFFLLASAFIVGSLSTVRHASSRAAVFSARKLARVRHMTDDANQQKDDDELHRAPFLTLRSDESITSTIAKFTVPYVMVG
jgi:hypothetical protein